MRAGAPEAGLHFIGNANTAGAANVFVNMFEVTIRKNDTAADALNGFGDKGADLTRSGEVEKILHISRVVFSSIDIVAPPQSAIGVSHDGMMHAETVRHIKFPRAVRSEAHRRRAATVIRVAQRDDVVIAGVSARH